MSNPNFVSDLVAMAKAFEELPQVQAALFAKDHEAKSLADTVTQREASIQRLKAELEALQAAKRTVEAERDDAELRFLESEDRVSSALNFIKGTFGSAGSLIQALEPPAPVAVPTPPTEPEVKFSDTGIWPGGQEDGVVKVGASEGNPSPSGQSDYTPMVPSSTIDGGSSTVEAKADATTGQGAASRSARRRSA